MRYWLLVISMLMLSRNVAAEGLVISLSNQHIDINSTYTGAQLALFGVVIRDGRSASRADAYDVLVTVRGPEGLVTVRRKERFGPIWINRDQRKFGDVPATLSLISTRPAQEIVDPEFLARFGMTLDTYVSPKGPPDAAPFARALLRLKQESDLFTLRDRDIAFITPDVFRARIDVPGTGPLGVYHVDAALFAGGVKLAQAETFFTVGKVGFEQLIAREARDHGLLYGMATAALALGFGWLASVIFRRD